MAETSAAEVQGTGNPMADAARVQSGLTRYTLKLPSGLREHPNDPTTVVMQELSVKDEQQASRRAKGDGGGVTDTSISYELLKAAVVEVDGKPLTWNNAEKERFIEGISAKVRVALLRAYQQIHIPQDKDVDDFLGSMRVQG